MKRLLSAFAAAGALAACGAAGAPPMTSFPPEARADPAKLVACDEVSVLLDRRVNYLPALLDFLDEVRRSECGYPEFRVDITKPTVGSSYNDGFSRNEALDEVRRYRRSYGLDWTALPYQEDARIPPYHIRVLFLNAPARANLDESI